MNVSFFDCLNENTPPKWGVLLLQLS